MVGQRRRAGFPIARGGPYAVAIGDFHPGNIFIFRLDKAKTATILRQFRGHEGGVLSIAVSRDRRYLATGSDDATVRVWNLTDLTMGTCWVNRWGAGFEIRNGQLFATGVREDGRLHSRGVRTDDVLRSIGWEKQRCRAESQRPSGNVECSANLQLGYSSRVRFSTS